MSVQASTNFNQIYLAFDIQDVLALTYADEISAPLFQSYGMLLQVAVEGYPKRIRHYIYPFAKELFQLLAQTPGVHFSFFSSCKAIFAIPFVNEFLTKSLGEEGYANIAEKVRVCAREQLRSNKCYNGVSISRHCRDGSKRKDLDDVFPELEIPHAQRILIDNNPAYAAPHQVKSLIRVTEEIWTDKLSDYYDDGFGLSIFSSYEELEKSQRMKKPRMSIALYLKQPAGEEAPEHYVVVYFDEVGRKELELNAEESAKIKALHKLSILQSSVFFETKHGCTVIQKELSDQLERAGLLDPFAVKRGQYTYIYGEGTEAKECMKTASGEDIAIHLVEGGANIYYSKKINEVISLNDRGSLMKLSREVWEQECRNRNTFIKESNKSSAKAQLYDLVWDKVKNLVWKEQIIHQANHILLLTGAIFAAWEESKATQKPLNKILFNWQCEDEGGMKEFNTHVLTKRSELYQKGLELLRQVNPHLEPITIKSFETALATHPTLPDDGAVEVKGGRGCVIS